MLSSIQPGWTLRLLQLFWTDPQPRLEFQQQVQKWNTPVTEGLDILHQGLSLAGRNIRCRLCVGRYWNLYYRAMRGRLVGRIGGIVCRLWVADSVSGSECD
jgi:hypothetical protein